MSQKKKKTQKTKNEEITFIEDPFGFNQFEIEEAQQNQDQIILNEPSEEEIDHSDIEDEVSNEIKEISKSIQKDSAEELVSSVLNEIESKDKEQVSKTAVDTIEIAIEELQANIETLLFLSDRPISQKRLKIMINENLSMKQLKEALEFIQKRYQGCSHGIELTEVSGGYQFRTKLSQSEIAKKLSKVQVQKLSRGAMESLAIIAYNQPVMKDDIDKIRGVDSSYFIRNLLDRHLIHMSGRSELPGRPILYSTNSTFLELFGLNSLSDLPALAELEKMIPSSESDNPEDESPEIQKLRTLVSEMKEDSGHIDYDPKEDEKILTEMKEKIKAIPTSSAYIDQEKEAKKEAKKKETQTEN